MKVVSNYPISYGLQQSKPNNISFGMDVKPLEEYVTCMMQHFKESAHGNKAFLDEIGIYEQGANRLFDELRQRDPEISIKLERALASHSVSASIQGKEGNVNIGPVPLIYYAGFEPFIKSLKGIFQILKNTTTESVQKALDTKA